MTAIEKILYELLLFIKKFFQSFFISVCNPKKLFSDIKVGKTGSLINANLYFILILLLFITSIVKNSDHALNVFGNWVRLANSTIDTSLSEKLLYSLPITAILVFFLGIAYNIFDKSESRIYKQFAFYIIGSYFMVIIILQNIFRSCMMSVIVKIDAQAQMEGRDAHGEIGNMFGVLNEIGQLIPFAVTLALFVMFLFVFRRKNIHLKKEYFSYWLACAFLGITFYGATYLLQKQSALMGKLQLNDPISIIDETGSTNTIRMHTQQLADDSIILSCTLLAKNNLREDLFFTKTPGDKIVFMSKTTGTEQKAFLSLKFKPDSDKSKFVILKNSVLTELNFSDTLSKFKFDSIIVNRKDAIVHFKIFNKYSTMEDLGSERKLIIDTSYLQLPGNFLRDNSGTTRVQRIPGH